MTTARWQRISEKLYEAMHLDDEHRIHLLDEVGSCDPEMRREIETLLNAYDKAESTFLHTVDTNSQQMQASVPSMIGQRLGDYRIVELIGEGGMGEVYRAVRDDDQYQQQAAIKLVRAGHDSGFVIRRFKNERQILANLDHPNIAHLLDGGMTDHGVPFLVMELIEGEAIDQYCNGRHLSIAQRLDLFLKVCSAVQFAHQRLIIHRDIKPGNILVTGDGVPKLLDFGIAKILDKETGGGVFEPTVTVFRALTPAYASPEQVRGLPITTAGDVYSLGVVLYELLTGVHPYRQPDSTPEQIARAVCETEPEKPSTAVLRRPRRQGAELRDSNAKLAKRLRGDLDNIVLMSVRKEPNRRYTSVEQFAEDVRRHLRTLPVAASRGSWSYRASKFVKRYRAAVTATAATIVILLAAFFFIIREAHIAREERTRAEQRFNDVRKLANSLIFDIHDSIQDLPGSTPARKMLIERAFAYLDSLSHEPGIDRSLLREMAAGYDKIGDVQGTPFGSNLGDTKAAMESYGKALAVRERLWKSNPNNIEDGLAVAQSQRRIAGMAAFRAEPDAVEKVEQALGAAQSVLIIAPQSRAAFAEVSIDHAMLAAVSDGLGHYQQSLPHARTRLSMLQQQLQTDPNNRALRGSEAVTEGRIGYELEILGFRQEAQQHFDRSLQIAESLASDPMDVERKRIFALMLQWYAGNRFAQGDSRGAFRTLQKAVGILEPLAAADPRNKELNFDLATDVASEGETLSLLGASKQGLLPLERAIAMLESAMARDPADTEPRAALANARIFLGDALASRGENARALENYKKALALWEKMAADSSADRFKAAAALAHARIGSILTKTGKLDEAADELQHALKLVEPLVSNESSIMDSRHAAAETYAGLGDLYRRNAQAPLLSPQQQLEYWKNAQSWYRRSLDMWQHIPDPGVGIPFAPLGISCRRPKAIAAAVAECNGAFAKLQGSTPTVLWQSR